MVGAIVDSDLHVHDRVAGEHALDHRLLNALVDRGGVLARDAAPHDLVEELVAAAGVRLEAQPGVAELARAAGTLYAATDGEGVFRLDLKPSAETTV